MDFQRPQLDSRIDGERVTNLLYIDFAKADLEFRTWHKSGDHHLGTLSAHDLEQPATDPPLTHVQIVCDEMPRWPIDLDLNVNDTLLLPPHRQRSPLPYLTVEDVVHAVHASLHRKITHKEWSSLSVSQKTDIARAFAHRYEASVNDEMELLENLSEGITHVDCLGRNTWFGGFTWLESKHGVPRLKLHLRYHH
jgi:hypothetical protein